MTLGAALGKPRRYRAIARSKWARALQQGRAHHTMPNHERHYGSLLFSKHQELIRNLAVFREQYAAQREGPTTTNLYTSDKDWEGRLHSPIDLPPPSELVTEFWDLWLLVMGEMRAKGFQPGPASFKGWNDGDAGFVRAIWCLVRHLKPMNVVETGVAHGVTSRFVLEALERNGHGHLWSVDRPPIEREWQQQIGIAVDDALRKRWSYILGSSRRRLPGLLNQLGQIDLFIHDSLHSERNVRFELDQAWAVLRPSGVLIASCSLFRTILH
jgi:Methyltransferase domain